MSVYFIQNVSSQPRRRVSPQEDGVKTSPSRPTNRRPMLNPALAYYLHIVLSIPEDLLLWLHTLSFGHNMRHFTCLFVRCYITTKGDVMHRSILTGPSKKKLRYIVAHYRGQKPIIVAHDRISHPEKNYDRKNLTYRGSSLSRKKLR